jgi:electron transfer flavoprotein beta subunit
MRIVVAIKAVATLDEEHAIEEGATVVDADFLDWSLNEWDAFSVEAALQLAERHDGEVVAVTVGGDEAHEALLACLANGAARGVRVEDEGLDGADALGIARVLAAVVARERPDLVLCGAQSSDAASSATGIALAAHLDLPHVAVVTSIEVEAAAGRMTVERELEGGTIERLRIGLPALLTVQTGINQPRYATLRAIKQAREKPLEVLALDDLGLDGAELERAAGAQVRALAIPRSRGGAEMLTGSTAEVADRIAAIVRERVSA